MVIKFIYLYMIFLISSFAHELGHIMMVKIFYDVENCKINLGLWKRIFKFKKITINAIPGFGLALWEFKDYESFIKSSKLRKIMPSLGGPLVNLLIIFIFTWILNKNNYSDFYNQIIKYVIMYNIFSFISSILPIKYINHSSDGTHIFNIIKYNKW